VGDGASLVSLMGIPPIRIRSNRLLLGQQVTEEGHRAGWQAVSNGADQVLIGRWLTIWGGLVLEEAQREIPRRGIRDGAVSPLPRPSGPWQMAQRSLYTFAARGVLDWVDLTLEARNGFIGRLWPGFGGGMREARSLELIA
jgi:hypothetical protein